ncbi:MAG: hypothetical protein ABSB41_18245 [Anaerolineales bacterium]|jgi:hypothetical protein
MNEINEEVLMEITITGNLQAIEKLKEFLDDEGAYQSLMNAISEDIQKLIAKKAQLKDKELSVLVIEREMRREMRQLEKLVKLSKKL